MPDMEQIKKVVFIGVGILSVILGIVGIFVPGLPTRSEEHTSELQSQR